ncbi:MAG: hypothetical protein ABIN89_10325 [Chitinophagaceae bacterium]
MGSIWTFDLSRIIQEYKTPHFFETGTFMGDGVEYALLSPFKKITSVEIIHEIADEAKRKFISYSKVEIIEDDSVSALTNNLPHLDGNCIFWLDAHFPGADAGMTDYDAGGNETLRLPLINEIELIHQRIRKFKDVLVIDDLRIYEEGPFANGNVPVDALPVADRNINFIYECYGRSHVILKSYLDEGYVLVFPKRKYKLKLFFNNLFGKKIKEDFYLSSSGTTNEKLPLASE